MAKSKVNWNVEIDHVKQMGSEGKTYEEIAQHYGVTRERVRQVVEKRIPDWTYCYGGAVRRRDRFNRLIKEYTDKYGERDDTDLYRAKRKKFFAKKSNAKRNGYSWGLKFGDLSWPSHCPILGLSLDYFTPHRIENSVSFDRYDNNKGYETGNVFIISWRANRIKNDGTADEHLAIANWIIATLP